MSEKNVLILQSEIVLKDYDLDKLHDKLLEQKESGLILLPSYVKVVKVPEGEIDGQLVVINCEGFKPKSKAYVIKRKGWNYVLNVRPTYDNVLLVDYTDFKMAAMQFNKDEAEQLLKRMGNGYEMEEL